jgi:alkylhydroperoxidase family enzyme
MSESYLDCLRDEIAFRLRRGERLAEVERELIAPARLSEDERAALWLFAWSYLRKAERDARRVNGLLAR